MNKNTSFTMPGPAIPERPRDLTISLNEAAILNLVRQTGEISRKELTDETSLTKQSISRIVDSLTERGMLSSGGRVVSGPGKPSTLIKLVPDAAYSIGISIMSDAITGVLMNLACEAVSSKKVHLESTDLESIFSTIENLIDNLISTSSIKQESVCGVGVAITGYFTGEANQINPVEPLSSLAKLNIDQKLAERLQLPVWVDNDGNAAAVGEILTGVGRRFNNFAYIFHTYGVGGALVVNNQLIRGAYGNAGEFSGILAPNLLENRPTLELLRKMVGEAGIELEDINELVEKFDISWPGIHRWIETVSPTLSIMITSIAAVLDPQAIVLGGRLPTSLASALIPHLTIHEGPTRMGRHQPRPKILPSEVQGDAAALGASAIPMKASIFI